MLFGNIPHIQHETEQAFDLASAQQRRLNKILGIAVLYELLLCLRYGGDIRLSRILYQVFLQPGIVERSVQMV